MNSFYCLSPRECGILRDILHLKIRQHHTSSDMANMIGVSPRNPYFNNIIKLLKQLNIINVVNEIGSCKLLQINNKKLEMLLHDQKFINEWVDKYFYNENYILSWRGVNSSKWDG